MTDPETRTAIQDVVAGVAHRIDRRDWAGLRALFADRVDVDYTSLFGGDAETQDGDALIGGWRALLTPLRATQHLLGPVVVEAREDRATARCHVRNHHFAPGAPGGAEWTVAGHYVFRLRRGDDGTWRIVAMTLEALYQTGNRNLLEEAGKLGA